MEPWTPLGPNLISDHPACDSSASGRTDDGCRRLAFEDSFFDGNTEPGDVPRAPFEPLPDSVEYLSRLEAKLRKIQEKSRPSKDKHKEGAKEAAFRNLLRQDVINGGITTDLDVDLEREVANNRIVRALIPEQPVCAGETVHLITADHLDNDALEDSDKGGNVDVPIENASE